MGREIDGHHCNIHTLTLKSMHQVTLVWDMAVVKLEHFLRAASDIAENGDNDTLPFDIDTRFVEENSVALSEIAANYFEKLEKAGSKNALASIESLEVFSERLLTPTGPAGFRITTKIHPFWNLYFNGLGVAIAEALEPRRSARAMSYRFAPEGNNLFKREASWRNYLEASIENLEPSDEQTIVIKTDIASFYDHAYHHRIENLLEDFFPKDQSTIAVQVDRFLSRFASGRSFGLPVGGQCSRILAEVLMASVDAKLIDEGVNFYRYVDDFTIIAKDSADSYRALSTLSNALADYGLTLNRTKTITLSARHYKEYVALQLGDEVDDESRPLREVDLYFDPYSDNPADNFEELRAAVRQIDVQKLLRLELDKSKPDAFIVSQISRTLRFHPPEITKQLIYTLLEPKNLQAFRGSWSTIMRGIAVIRGDETFKEAHEILDQILDSVPEHSPHLLIPDTNILFFLKTLRWHRTDKRAQFVSSVYNNASSKTVKRACIECGCEWKQRSSFTAIRNQWNNLDAEVQRMLWYHAEAFGDEGRHFRKQTRRSVPNLWRLGFETDSDKPSFAVLYADWH